ncbi:hypothetical protein SeMB42_g07989 [Synchytrium endobioticum]|uniref:Transmembrane protein n=1 Tax=Synchytrium endobioticum TaxID=286115 RepID=A0A507BWA4_9FUNG|nr:hypothetical protein SeMB42_g07989 [Synchytrium endobioticum]
MYWSKRLYLILPFLVLLELINALASEQTEFTKNEVGHHLSKRMDKHDLPSNNVDASSGRHVAGTLPVYWSSNENTVTLSHLFKLVTVAFLLYTAGIGLLFGVSYEMAEGALQSKSYAAGGLVVGASSILMAVFISWCFVADFRRLASSQSTSARNPGTEIVTVCASVNSHPPEAEMNDRRGKSVKFCVPSHILNAHMKMKGVLIYTPHDDLFDDARRFHVVPPCDIASTSRSAEYPSSYDFVGGRTSRDALLAEGSEGSVVRNPSVL